MSELGFHPGDEIGTFTVIVPCGAGAFGQVYLVCDAEGRRFALKVLSPDRRGERELAGLMRFQRVSHPDLLHIDRVSTLPDGRIFYTMDAADNAAADREAYEPDTLARRLRERGTIPPEELKRIMLELASGAAALHRAHLLHRDIKPENILFVGGKAVLADAGAVGDAGGKTLVGTPDYLPPEVCLGKRAFTAADDGYALGKVLYTALTGEPPRRFPSTPDTLDTPEKVALFEIAERACTPPGLSVYRFRELLEHPEALKPRRHWRRLAAAAAVGVGLVALAFAVLVSRRPRAVSPPPEPPPVRVPEAVPEAAKAPEREPTLAELLKKYGRTAEEQRLVDRWIAECAAFDRRIGQAAFSGDKTEISRLTAEKRTKLPYGIADFCGDEMRMRKWLEILTRDCTPEKRQQLELALRHRRDVLKNLLEKLPADELAKWR